MATSTQHHNDEDSTSKWIKFLTPLVGAMITALGVYATAAQQQYSHDNDRRVTVMESRLREMETLKDDVKTLSAEVHELIGELRAARSMQLRGR